MRAWAEIDAAAIEANTRIIKRHVGSAELIAVVKGDAYGHGLRKSAAAGRAGGASRLAVNDVSELRELRMAGDDRSILVLGPTLPTEIGELLRFRAELVVSDFVSMQRVRAEAENLGVTAHLHLAVETGLGRDGFLPEALPSAVEFVRSHSMLRIAGVMSHLRGSRDHSAARNQLALFEHASSRLPRSVLRHIANSSGIALGKDYFLDAVRPGLALYGLSESCAGVLPLMTALALRTQIAELHERRQGSSVGYRSGFRLLRDSTLGVLPIGFVHGYPRNSPGPVLINGTRVPIIGPVNMLTTIIDLTDMPWATVGQPVTLLGADGGDEIKAIDLCRGDELIPNQFTCSLTRFVDRFYVDQLETPAWRNTDEADDRRPPAAGPLTAPRRNQIS